MSRNRPRQDAKTRITKFLAGEEILLTGEEEKILKRWEMAYDLLAAKKLTWLEIRDKIAFKHAVSKFTAENDLVNAQEVYGLNRKINKRFLMHLHLDRIDQDIERIRQRIYWMKDDEGRNVERIPTAKEMIALKGLEEAYTYALANAPEGDDKVKFHPPVYVFRLPDGIDFPMTELNKLLEYTDQYIDYEMVNNGTTDIQPARSAGDREGDAPASPDDPADQG